MNNFIQTVIAK